MRIKKTKDDILMDLLADEVTPEQLELEFGDGKIEVSLAEAEYDAEIVKRLVDG